MSEISLMEDALFEVKDWIRKKLYGINTRRPIEALKVLGFNGDESIEEIVKELKIEEWYNSILSLVEKEIEERKKIKEIEEKATIRRNNKNPYKLLLEKQKNYEVLFKYLSDEELKESIRAAIIDPNKKYQKSILIRIQARLDEKLRQLISKINAEYGTNYSLNSFIETVLFLVVDYLEKKI